MILSDRIVSFTDKEDRTVYAIERSFLLFKLYKDLKSRSKTFWWGRNSCYFKDCLTHNKDTVLEHMRFTREYNAYIKKNSRKTVTIEELLDEPDETLETNRLERLGVNE